MTRPLRGLVGFWIKWNNRLNAKIFRNKYCLRNLHTDYPPDLVRFLGINTTTHPTNSYFQLDIMPVNTNTGAKRVRTPEICPHCMKLFKRWSVKSHIAKGYCKETSSYKPYYMRQNAWIDSSIKKTDRVDKFTQSDEDFEGVPDKNVPVEQAFDVKGGIAADAAATVEDQDSEWEEGERNVAVYVRRLYIYNY